MRGLPRDWGRETGRGIFGPVFRRGRGNVAWIVRLVSIGAEGEEHSTDVMRIAKPDTLHRAGLRVGTALTEGTANFLVNRRMNKSQQMRWSRRGADRLLQVR